MPTYRNWPTANQSSSFVPQSFVLTVQGP